MFYNIIATQDCYIRPGPSWVNLPVEISGVTGNSQGLIVNSLDLISNFEIRAGHALLNNNKYYLQVRHSNNSENLYSYFGVADYHIKKGSCVGTFIKL